jgi:hypothetical protein
MVLLTNSLENGESQLWLIDLSAGHKFLVDSDCAGASSNGAGLILVRGALNNEARLYRIGAAKPAEPEPLSEPAQEAPVPEPEESAEPEPENDVPVNTGPLEGF